MEYTVYEYIIPPYVGTCSYTYEQINFLNVVDHFYILSFAFSFHKRTRQKSIWFEEDSYYQLIFNPKVNNDFPNEDKPICLKKPFKGESYWFCEIGFECQKSSRGQDFLLDHLFIFVVISEFTQVLFFIFIYTIVYYISLFISF